MTLFFSFLAILIAITYQQCLSSYQYSDPNSGTCKPCAVSCKQCFNEVFCMQCTPQYYLSNGQCLSCSFGCSVCTNATSCSTCNNGLYLTSAGGCSACGTGVATCTIATIQTCSDGYFLLGSICAGCLTNCKTCSDFVTCSTCTLGYFLASTGTSCSACPQYCRICSNATSCSQCMRGYTQNAVGCVAYSCASIDPFCESCANGYCLSCQSGKYLAGGVCQQGGSLLCLQASGPYDTNCQTSGYGCQSYSSVQVDASSNQMPVCLPLKASKLTEYIYTAEWTSPNCSLPCSAPSQVTHSYSTSQTYYSITLYLNIRFYGSATSRTLTIALQQQNGTVIVSNVVVVDVSTEMGKYSDVDTSCNSCPFGQKIVTTSFGSSGGQYPTNVSVADSAGLAKVVQAVLQHQICQVQHCSNCASAVQCSTCSSPYYLQLTSCVLSCDPGFYLYSRGCYLTCPSGSYTITSSYTCSACISPCATCTNSSSCLSCLSGFYLQGDQCLASCSSLYLFANATSKACETCPNPCLTCQVALANASQVLCLSCEAGYLLSSGSCIYICPWGSYGTYLNGTSQCSSCQLGCAGCYINSSTCTACTASYLLVGTACTVMSLCPDGYYLSTLNRCLACHYPCKTCASTGSNCTSCVRGALYNNQCLGNCPDYYYPDYANSSNVTCQPCLSPCLTCKSGVSCLSCPNGTYLSSSTCAGTCPDGYFPLASNNSCVGCSPPCKTCTTGSVCLTCSSGYLDGTVCTLQCNSTSYIDSTFVCKICPTPCIKCYSAGNCLGCQSPFLLYASSCISQSQCSSLSGYYSAPTTGVCSPCGFPCQTCINNSITCLSCLSGYLFTPVMSRCFSACPTSYYQSGTTCLVCDSNCYLCSAAATTCTACGGGLFLSSSNSCVQNCPDGYYGEESSSQCKTCLTPCGYCYSPYLCKTCLTGILYSKGCVSSCPQSTFYNATLNECLSCTSNCLTCMNSSSTCLSCPSGYYFLSSSCLSVCPSSHYSSDYSRTCQPCISPCLTCTSSSSCLTCIATYFLSSVQCLSACPSSYFTDTNTSSCVLCNLTICLTCSLFLNNCTTCNVGYYMFNTSCVSSCGDGYYADSISGICQLCPFPCQNCLNYTYCSTCMVSYYIFSNRCFSRCPTGYYPDNTTCQLCGTNCLSCNSTSCLQCVSTYYVLNGSCISSCPLGYYPGTESVTNYDKCMLCQSDCLNCTAYDYCVQCLSNLIQFNGLCLTECPIFYFPFNGTLCSSCSQYCTSCLNETYCLNCIGSFLLNGSCLATCPSAYYPLENVCKVCLSPCWECTGDYTCTSCLPSYIYFHNYCVGVCPSDVWYYPSNNSCNPSCPYNKYSTNMTCFIGRCGTQMVALNGYCLEECSTNYYVDASQQCQLCTDGSGMCSPKFEADLQILYMDVLSLVLYYNQKAEIAPFEQITISIVDIDGNTVPFTLTSYEITEYKIEFKFNRKAVSLVNVSLTIPYIKSETSGQRISSNRFKKQLPSYEDYSSNEGASMVSYIPMATFAGVLVLTVINIVNKASRFVQIFDYFQLVAVTLYLNIQYPPILQSFLSGFKFSLFSLTKNMIALTPFAFSPPKFIYYHTDTSLFRNQLMLFLIFLACFLTCVTIIVVHTLRKQCCREVVRVVRYRMLNDLFSICLTPLFLFACQFAHATFIFVSGGIVLLGFGYVAWISYKIIQVKKMSQLSGLLGDFERTQSKIGLMYIPFSFVRRMIFTIGLGIAPYEPISTITLLLVLTFLIMVCIYFYQPFDNQYTDYVTIFMESSLTLYVVCLIVLGLNVLDTSNSNNMAIFTVALVTITIGVCLTWLTYLTINDVRTKGWCPKMKEEDKEGTVDYSEKKYDQDEEQIRKMEGLPRPTSKKGTKAQPKENVQGQKLKQQSANELMMRYGSAGSDQLFSRHNDNNDQFRHWSEQTSNKGISQPAEAIGDRDGSLPQLLVKITKNDFDP